MYSDEWSNWIKIGSRALKSRAPKVEFYSMVCNIGAQANPGAENSSTIPPELRYVTNYFNGRVSFIPAVDTAGGVVQLLKRDTGVINVAFNECENAYSCRVAVEGVKAVQKDVLSESAYIYALETVHRAWKVKPENAAYKQVMETLADLKAALYSTIPLPDAATLTDKLTADLEHAIQDASLDVAEACGQARNVVGIRGFVSYPTAVDNVVSKMTLANPDTCVSTMAITDLFEGVHKSSYTRKADKRRQKIIDDNPTVFTRAKATVAMSGVTANIVTKPAAQTSTTPAAQANTTTAAQTSATPAENTQSDNTANALFSISITQIGPDPIAVKNALIDVGGFSDNEAQSLIDNGGGSCVSGLSREEIAQYAKSFETTGATMQITDEETGVLVEMADLDAAVKKTTGAKEEAEAEAPAVKITYPSEHMKYVRKRDKFYDALLNGDYQIDLEEFAPLIALCYQEAGETITEGDIANIISEAKKNVPSLSFLESYLPIKDFQTMVLSIRNNLTDMLAIMKNARDAGEKIPYNKLMRLGTKNWYLVGPPGAGKSVSAQAVAAAIGLPFYTVAASRNVEEDMFQGGLGIKDGKQDNIASPYVEGIHSVLPSIVSIEEINALSPGVALALNSHCETPYSINLYGQKMVRRNPGAYIIASGNRDLAGLQEQNTALLSRFLALDIEKPSTKQFAAIARQMVPHVSDEAIDYMVSSFESVIGAISKEMFDVDRESLLTGVTIRQMTQSLNLIADGIDPAQAAKAGLLSTVVPQSKDAYDILAGVIDAKPVPNMPETER